MHQTVVAIASACCLLLSGTIAAHALTIGVSAPLSGPNETLGRQVIQGAGIGAAAVDAAIETRDDSCSAEGGAAAARDFANAKVDIVIGFLCTEAIEAALPILKDAGIPAITVGVRTQSLTERRDKTGWEIWRLGPRGSDEREAAATFITRLWRDELFAIVDDGTIYGRELAETVRNAAEMAALKPVFTDTYRPESDNHIGLIGRLRRAGATHVFVGGDGNDVAVMGRDAAQLEVGMTFAGGETLRAAGSDISYAEGTLMVALPEWADIADRAVLETFAERNIVPEGYALPAYAAVETARAAADAAAREGTAISETLTDRAFDTAIGSVRFDTSGDLSGNPYRIFRFEDGGFVALAVEGQ